MASADESILQHPILDSTLAKHQIPGPYTLFPPPRKRFALYPVCTRYSPRGARNFDFVTQLAVLHTEQSIEQKIERETLRTSHRSFPRILQPSTWL